MTYQIFVPLDGSSCAARALQHAIHIAKAVDDAVLHVAHAHEEPLIYGEIAVYVTREKMERWLREESEHNYQAGHAAALRLLRRPDRPDAIFCVSDAVAFGAIDAARYDFGLRVPEDVSIIGFDDLPTAAWPARSTPTPSASRPS